MVDVLVNGRPSLASVSTNMRRTFINSILVSELGLMSSLNRYKQWQTFAECASQLLGTLTVTIRFDDGSSTTDIRHEVIVVMQAHAPAVALGQDILASGNVFCHFASSRIFLGSSLALYGKPFHLDNLVPKYLRAAQSVSIPPLESLTLYLKSNVPVDRLDTIMISYTSTNVSRLPVGLQDGFGEMRNGLILLRVSNLAMQPLSIPLTAVLATYKIVAQATVTLTAIKALSPVTHTVATETVPLGSHVLRDPRIFPHISTEWPPVYSTDSVPPKKRYRETDSVPSYSTHSYDLRGVNQPSVSSMPFQTSVIATGSQDGRHPPFTPAANPTLTSSGVSSTTTSAVTRPSSLALWPSTLPRIIPHHSITTAELLSAPKPPPLKLMAPIAPSSSAVASKSKQEPKSRTDVLMIGGSPEFLRTRSKFIEFAITSILDTASQYNIVDSYVWRALGKPTLYDVGHKIATAGGDIVSLGRFFSPHRLQVHSHFTDERIESFFVLKSFPVNVLIGFPSMALHRLIIDMATKTIMINSVDDKFVKEQEKLNELSAAYSTILPVQPEKSLSRSICKEISKCTKLVLGLASRGTQTSTDALKTLPKTYHKNGSHASSNTSSASSNSTSITAPGNSRNAISSIRRHPTKPSTPKLVSSDSDEYYSDANHADQHDGDWVYNLIAKQGNC